MEGSTDLGNMKGKTCLESKEEGVILHLMSVGDVQVGNLGGGGRDQAEVAEAGLAGHRHGSRQHTGGH